MVQKKECLLIFSSPDCSFRNIILHSTKFPMWLKISILCLNKVRNGDNSGQEFRSWSQSLGLNASSSIYWRCDLTQVACACTLSQPGLEVGATTVPTLLWATVRIRRDNPCPGLAWQLANGYPKTIYYTDSYYHPPGLLLYLLYLFWNEVRSNEFYMINMTY